MPVCPQIGLCVKRTGSKLYLYTCIHPDVMSSSILTSVLNLLRYMYVMNVYMVHARHCLNKHTQYAGYFVVNC